MIPKKITYLSHATLDPNLLLKPNAAAPKGTVHASAQNFLRQGDDSFALTGASTDVYLTTPAIAEAASALFLAIAQELANTNGNTVEYTVAGEKRTVEPQ